MMRHGLILVIIALLLAVSFQFDPRREAMTGDPQRVLSEWSTRDQELNHALQAADRGDHQPLAVWLSRAEQQERETFALLVSNQIIKDMGVDAEGDLRMDDRPLYRWRHRLMAFQDVVIGDADLDQKLDNDLAYGLVAGTSNPTATDLAIARTILPRLIKQVSSTEINPTVQDTIGCVHFALGDYAKAVTSFEQVLKAFESESARSSATWFTSEVAKRKAAKQRTHQQALLSQRLDAARNNAARVVAGKVPDDPEMLPLPRDLGQSRPEPSTPGPAAIEASGAVP